MPGRDVIFHVGPPKSGTTYLQGQLRANTTSLREHGFDLLAQQTQLRNAASELGGIPRREDGAVPRGAWDRLRADIDRAPRSVVVSCERFSLLDADAARIVRAAFPGDRVRAALTVRGPAAVLPSAWQERMKRGGTIQWSGYCRRLERDPELMSEATRITSTLDAWSQALSPQNVSVVVVPPPEHPRAVLVNRFCAATGIPAHAIVTTAAARTRNSIGLEGGDLLRRLNSHHEEIPAGARRVEFHRFLAARLGESTIGSRPALSPRAYELAQEHTEDVIEQIHAAGHPVTGDLADLLSATPPDPDAALDPDAEAVLEAAVDAILGLSVRAMRFRERAESQGAPPAAAPGRARRLAASLLRALRSGE